MFTGIIEELGEVVSLAVDGQSARLDVRGPLVTGDAVPGASIAVNGCCLTVTDRRDDVFGVDVMLATLQRTSLGHLDVGAPVNLERAMPAGGRFGGHVVQGHVDATGTVVSRTPGQRWDVVRISMPPDLVRYVVAQGSITVDGVSLTVSAECRAQFWFEVSLIPTTLELTTLGRRRPGEPVNLEVDVLAKYVERQLAYLSQPTHLSQGD